MQAWAWSSVIWVFQSRIYSNRINKHHQSRIGICDKSACTSAFDRAGVPSIDPPQWGQSEGEVGKL